MPLNLSRIASALAGRLNPIKSLTHSSYPCASQKSASFSNKTILEIRHKTKSPRLGKDGKRSRVSKVLADPSKDWKLVVQWEGAESFQIMIKETTK